MQSRPVLVVEGDEEIRDVIAVALSDAGYPVETCSRPEDAVALLTERGPEAVSLVLTRPIFGPLHEPYLWLDQMRAVTSAPIIIATRWPRSWFSDYAARGYAGLLSQPVDLRELVRLVQSLAPHSG